MADNKPYPKVDFGRNINAPNVLIVGAGIAGVFSSSYLRHLLIDDYLEADFA